jgi:hypothetical protein
MWKNAQGKPMIRRPKSQPLANHYHFHIIDQEWAHQHQAQRPRALRGEHHITAGAAGTECLCW